MSMLFFLSQRTCFCSCVCIEKTKRSNGNRRFVCVYHLENTTLHAHMSPKRNMTETSPSQRRHTRPPMLNLPRSGSLKLRPVPSKTRVEEEAADGDMWAVHARRGRRRAIREDMYATYPFATIDGRGLPVSLFAVFDGHGGARAAQYTSNRLPSLLLHAITTGQPIAKAMETGFLTTDREFSAISPTSPRPSSSTSKTSRTTTNTATSKNMENDMCFLSSSSSSVVSGDGETSDLRRTPSGSLFASVALKSADLNGFLLSRMLTCASDNASRKDMLMRSYSVDVSGISNSASSLVRMRGNSSGSGGDGSRGGRELRRCKTRVDEHLSSVPVRTGHACGTTATVVAIAGNEMVVAHVGDTRAVLCLQDGTVTRLCEDHRPGREDELKRIESAGGLVVQVRGTSRVNGVLAVSRAIGDLELKELVIARPDVSTFQLTGDEHFVMVATDGLWDVISDKEGVDIVKRTFSSKNMDDSQNWEQMAVKALVECAWERGTTDDVCILVIDLKKHKHACEQLRTKGSSVDPIGKGVRAAEVREAEALAVEGMTPVNEDGDLLLTQRRQTSKPW